MSMPPSFPPGPLGCFGGMDSSFWRFLYRKGGHQRLSRPSVQETLAKEPLQFGPCGRPGPGSVGAQLLALMTQWTSGSCMHSQCSAILLSWLPERFTFPAWKNSSQLMILLLRMNEIILSPEGKPVSAQSDQKSGWIPALIIPGPSQGQELSPSPGQRHFPGCPLCLASQLQEALSLE